MGTSIRHWWKWRGAFITARERELRVPAVGTCAIWPEEFPKKSRLDMLALTPGMEVYSESGDKLHQRHGVCMLFINSRAFIH